MPTETNYSARWASVTLIPKDRDHVVEMSLERNGAAPTVTAVTFTLFDTGGTKLIDAAAATETAGKLTYTVPAATTTDKSLGSGYMVRFEVTIASQVYWFSNAAAVCLQLLYCPIGTTDLVNRYPKLSDLQVTGASDLQAFVSDAFDQLINKMHSGGLPFWTIRSPSNLKPWLMTRSLSWALASLALVLGKGGPYRDESRRLEAMLKGQYEQIRSTMDVDENNSTSTVQTPTSGVIQLSSSRGGWR
tara:strand:+ start:6704 stop:7441 length:738 start_codon:yes stop_codon:yes gene_type:complete